MTSPGAWPGVEALLRSDDVTALTLAVDDLDDDARQACVRPLRMFVREQDPWSGERVRAGIVGAGVLPDAKSVAAMLTRGVESAPHVAFVLTRRGVDWLPELIGLLAAKLSRDHLRYVGSADHAFELVQKLRAVTGTPAPVTDGFVVGVVGHLTDQDQVTAAFAADPSLTAVVPRLFEIDHAGLAMSHGDGWTTALVTMAADGRLDRTTLVDACTARLARDGKPGASTVYLHIAQALKLRPDEVGQRVSGFVAMLAAPTLSTIASFAQSALIDLAAAPGHALSDIEATAFTAAALRRGEKKVVRAQLSWIRGLVARERVPHLAAVAEAMTTLPADLARVAAALLPTAGTPLRVVSSGAPQLQPVVAEAVQPLHTLREVADELGAFFTWSPQQEARQPARLERLVDALIRWRGTDRAALRAAVSHHVEEQAHLREYYEYAYNRTLAHAVTAVVCAAADLEPMPEHTVDEWLRRRPPALHVHAAPPGRHAAELVIERLFALARELHSDVGHPVALPTHDNGTIAAEAFVDRLTRAAAAGVEPYPAELDQAMLRTVVPEHPDALVDELRALATPSAARAADHFATTRPEPVLTRISRARDDAGWDSPPTRRWTDLLVRVRPADDADDAGTAMWRQLCLFDPMHHHSAVEETYAMTASVWVAPRHREVMAAHLLPWLLDGAHAELLPALAYINGAYGDAMALALVHGLTAPRASARDHAVDAAILLCRKGLLDGGATGTLLGDLVSRGALVPQRAVEPLRRVAAAGAHRQVWLVLEAALPALLAAEPRGLADLLALGIEVATACGARATVAGLDDFAARKGSSRQLVEARLLRDALTGARVRTG